MPLVYIVSLNAAGKADINQIIDLLTGVMTTQAVTIANDLTAKSLKSSGVAALTSPLPARCVGAWGASGAPAGLTGQLNDYGWDNTQTLWVCTAAGTPGTWKQAAPSPNSVAGNIKPLSSTAAAGASGLSADASHIHAYDGLVVSGGGTMFKNWVQATDPGGAAANGDTWDQA